MHVSKLSQTQGLLAALKKQLKTQGKTYKDLAQYLCLSEASVKRLFSEQTLSLQRLEQICDFLGMNFFELATLSVKSQIRVQALTLEEETCISQDTTLLLITLSVLNGFSFDELLNSYNISMHDCVRRLIFLDKAKVIELMPGNRIRLLVAPNFSWLKNGPIQQYFLKKVQGSFFDSTFDSPVEKLLVLNGVLSVSSNHKLQQRIEKLYLEFNTLMQQDQKLPITERSGNTMVLALRQWQYPEFVPLCK